MKLFLEVFGPIAVLCFALVATNYAVSVASPASDLCVRCEGEGDIEKIVLVETEKGPVEEVYLEECPVCEGEGVVAGDRTYTYVILFCIIGGFLGIAYHRLRKLTLGKFTVSTGGDTKVEKVGS